MRFNGYGTRCKFKELLKKIKKYMRVAIIGRSEILYKSAIDISKNGHEISCIITAKKLQNI